MLGELERSGVGQPMHVDYVRCIADLQRCCRSSNAELLQELREDSHAQELMRLTQEDASKGRMTAPVAASTGWASELLLNPRFGVERERADGSIKIRAVDHLSWSPASACEADSQRRPSKKARKEFSVNGYTTPAEKMSHDTVDVLAAALRKFVAVVGCVPALFKACARDG